ncbi:Cupredoxin [Thozetella sp. PMI_491]|nr:Cupredoxin [Thozetella sp. PMI_491]
MSSSSLAKDWLSPPFTNLFQTPLPIPNVKQPKQQVLNQVTGKSINYYEINILPFTKQVYPGKGPAHLVGYDAISPGPTFLIEKGQETVVRFINNASMANSVHLHGSYSRSPWDGWADDVTEPGQFKDYYYPNSQNARMLWYHDHAVDHTAENAYFGQAGAYIIHDAAEDALNLPSGYGVHDIPIILASKQYQNNGDLFSPALETTSLYGDVIHANGQPWPYFQVEPRKYRLRFLNTGISRSYILYFETATGAHANFQVIAADAGLLSGPVTTNRMAISIAERYEVVFDFSPFAGQNVTLRNERDVGADDDFLQTDKVLRFVVSPTPVVDTSTVPSVLRTVPFPADKNTVDHHFRFERSGGDWVINGIGWNDVDQRVLANVPRGTIEMWELENGSGGGWSHPIHVHLVDFKVVSRTGGRNAVQPYEAAALKDVVWLDTGETVRLEAHYAPWDGLYMFHCHNLIHEDHMMMAAFNVTALLDLGYNETHFIDPMEPRWRAQDATPDKFTPAAITEKVQFMASLQPYNKVDEVFSVLDQYWATKTGAPVPGPTPKIKARRISRAESGLEA